VENYRRALINPTLQSALSIATGKATGARREAVALVGEENWEQLRRRARAIKEHTINHLDSYLEIFSAKVVRRGGHVFWAADARQANRYITELAQARGISLVVKGKSMMTEEVGLNKALAAAKIEAVETDLGEYIVQLAGERPSHINMPAIHKTRSDVANLFAEKLQVERTEEIAEMTALARKVLRRRFVEAGMGITGVNYAVAETGTIVLVENEGNIRMTTSLPRAHVALMGIEKVIPQFADLDIFLKLLSRSASGQKLCSYVSFLTGAKQSHLEEGPDELHVIILDNGRTKILANPVLRESLYCIRCGACLNVCPVYQKIGGHAYGWVYPGPIGAILTPQMIGRERAAALPYASTLCGACRDSCPVSINIPDMLLHLRHEIAESKHKPDDGPSNAGFKRSMGATVEYVTGKIWLAVMRNEARYGRAMQLLRFVQSIFGRRRKDGVRSLFIPRWSNFRDMPPVATQSFRERWPALDKRNGKSDG
jgi:L-lactate dehydrogenase complex protein LldF